jgi:hypothetical protein
MNTDQIIEWLGIQVQVPADWEIVRHSVSASNGQLAFVDHIHQRMILSWATFEKKPDLGRLMEDCRSRDKEQNPESSFAELSISSKLKGYRWSNPKESVTRAGFFDTITNRWIEAVITWPVSVDEPLEKSLLSSIKTIDTNKKGIRLRAFGMDVRAPAGWQFTAAAIKPGDLSFTFSQNSSTAQVRRLKAVSGWFNGDITAFVRKENEISRNVEPGIILPDHPMLKAIGKEKEFQFGWMVGLRRKRCDLAWLCPSNDMLFRISIISGGHSKTEPEQFLVPCCSKAQVIL